MLKSYLCQSAEYQRMNGVNERGEPQFTAAVTIPCRRVNGYAEAVEADRRIVKPRCVYYLDRKVYAGDRLDGVIVSAVRDMVMIDGCTIGCKAVIE